MQSVSSIRPMVHGDTFAMRQDYYLNIEVSVWISYFSDSSWLTQLLDFKPFYLSVWNFLKDKVCHQHKQMYTYLHLT